MRPAIIRPTPDNYFGLTDDDLLRIRSMRADVERLQAELDECAIWMDSSYGPPPSQWSDEMWAAYVKSRQGPKTTP